MCVCVRAVGWRVRLFKLGWLLLKMAAPAVVQLMAAVHHQCTAGNFNRLCRISLHISSLYPVDQFSVEEFTRKICK